MLQMFSRCLSASDSVAEALDLTRHPNVTDKFYRSLQIPPLRSFVKPPRLFFAGSYHKSSCVVTHRVSVHIYNLLTERRALNNGLVINNMHLEAADSCPNFSLVCNKTFT